MSRAGAAAPWEVGAPRRDGREAGPHGDGTRRTERLFDGKPQHLLAMEKAHAVKLARYGERRAVQAASTEDGARRIAELLRLPEPPEHLVTVEVTDLVGWIHRMGVQTVRRLLRGLRIPEDRQLNEISGRQRERLARALVGGDVHELDAPWEVFPR